MKEDAMLSETDRSFLLRMLKAPNHAVVVPPTGGRRKRTLRLIKLGLLIRLEAGIPPTPGAAEWIQLSKRGLAVAQDVKGQREELAGGGAGCGGDARSKRVAVAGHVPGGAWFGCPN